MAEHQESQRPRRLIRFPEVRRAVALGRTSIYERIKAGTFPPPIPLSEEGRAVAWLEEDISAWVDARVQQARGAK